MTEIRSVRSITLGCAFCTDFRSGDVPAFSKPRPAWLSESFAVTPTLGPLVTGHLLLLPRRHGTSFGQLSSAEWAEVVVVEAGIEALLTRRFGGTMAFEHGTSGVPTAGGCGIDHSHMHFVPVGTQIKGLPPVPNASWRRLGANWCNRLRVLANSKTPYVYVRAVDGARFVTPASSLPSQFVRRWVAKQLAVAQWDWRISDAEVDFAKAREWMAGEIPPAGFSPMKDLAEVAP